MTPGKRYTVTTGRVADIRREQIARVELHAIGDAGFRGLGVGVLDVVLVDVHAENRRAPRTA
jgi:hypothetical protein